MPGQGSRFITNSFHDIAVAGENIGMVIDNWIGFCVKTSREHFFR